MKKLPIAFLLFFCCLSLFSQKNQPSENWVTCWNMVEQGQYEEAIACFDQEVKTNPKSGYNYFGKGIALAAYGAYDESLQNFEISLKLLPKSERAGVYVYMSLVNKLKGELKLALEQINSAIKLDPNDMDKYRFRGEIHELMGDTTAAIADYQHIIDIAPQEPDGYLSMCYILKDKDLGEATAVCEKGMSANRNFADFYLVHAMLKCRAEQYEVALGDLIRYINMDYWHDTIGTLFKLIADNIPETMFQYLEAQQNKQTQNTFWISMTGEMYYYLGQRYHARQCYLDAYERIPDSTTLERLITMDLGAGEIAAAKQHLDELQRQYHLDSFEVEERKAVIAYCSGQFDEAIHICDSLLAIQYKDDIFIENIQLLYNAERYSELVQRLEIYLDTCQQPGTLFNTRGHAHLVLGDTAAAFKDFHQSLAIDSNRIIPYHFLGDHEKALSQMEVFYDLNSKDGQELYTIASTYVILGELDLAMEFLRKSFQKGTYWQHRHIIGNDPDFAPLRTRDDYKALIQEYEQKEKE
jgi:tetratricopeptide (TPR) repeat protein